MSLALELLCIGPLPCVFVTQNIMQSHHVFWNSNILAPPISTNFAISTLKVVWEMDDGRGTDGLLKPLESQVEAAGICTLGWKPHKQAKGMRLAWRMFLRHAMCKMTCIFLFHMNKMEKVVNCRCRVALGF